MQPTKEINLNPKITVILKELNKNLEEARQKTQAISLRLNDIVTGICLHENLNFEESDINFDQDLTKLIVTPKEKDEGETEVPKKTIRKKL